MGRPQPDMAKWEAAEAHKLGIKPEELYGPHDPSIPLHSRVARALNVAPTPRKFDDCHPGYGWTPHYDTDWSATGPLIERYRVSLTSTPDEWWAVRSGFNGQDGPTPLIAACNLILTLHKAGKLP